MRAQVRDKGLGGALRRGGMRRAGAVTLACVAMALPGQARAALYACHDDSGHEYRMHQLVEGSLIDIHCVPLDDEGAPPEQPASSRRGAVSSLTQALDRFSHPIAIVFPTSPDDVLAQGHMDALPAAFSSPLGFAKLSVRRSALLQSVAPMIRKVASEVGEDPGLLMAIVSVESGFNPSAVSPKGAVGLMQLMPATARRFGLQGGTSALFDPQVNLRVGARYLSYLKTLFPRELDRVIAAYNAGEGAVMRFGGRIPPFAETQAYVVSVRRAYEQFAKNNVE